MTAILGYGKPRGVRFGAQPDGNPALASRARRRN